MNNRIGLGTFPFASVFYKVERNRAIKTIEKFIEDGGYYIDTAPLYGFGEIEILLGEVLSKYKREQYFMETKCGYIDVAGKVFGKVEKSGKYNDVIRTCDESLKRLKIDYIDTYYMHSPDTKTPVEETMRALLDLKSNGKIKSIGVSNVSLIELKEYSKYGKIDFIQNRFNLITRSIDTEFEQYLNTNNIKLIPYHVLEIGLLTGKVFEKIENISDTDFRNTLKYWQKEQLDLVINWVKVELAPIARVLHMTIGQLAMSWVLEKDYVDHLIIGITNPEYIPIDFKVNDIKLSEASLKQINDSYNKLEADCKSKFGKSLREFRGLNEKYY